MSFSKLYRRKVESVGLNKYDRNFVRKQRTFDKFFENSLTRQNVIIDGNATQVVIQDQTQNNNKDLSDDKFLVAKNETAIKVGSLIEWDDSYWIAFSSEKKTIATHQQLKIRPSNYMMKFFTKDGEVCNNGLGQHAVVQNQTLYTLGVSTSTKNAWIVNAKMLMYLIDNEETKSLNIGSRLYIGNAVYQIMFKDNVSRKGLVHFLMEEDFVNENIDNVEEKIADYYLYYDKDGNKIEKETTESSTSTEETVVEDEDGNVSTESKEITIKIIGSEDVIIGKKAIFKAEVYEDGVLSDIGIDSWSVIDDDKTVSIESTDGNSIQIYAEKNYSNIDTMITIVAKRKDIVVSKNAYITSPY